MIQEKKSLTLSDRCGEFQQAENREFFICLHREFGWLDFDEISNPEHYVGLTFQ